MAGAWYGNATCADAFSATNIDSALESGSAAEWRKAKVPHLNPDRQILLPAVNFETAGVFGPTTSGINKDIGRRLAMKSGELRETVWLC